MKTSKAGRDLIRDFEGCRLAAYQCPSGVWTIGIGHTGHEVHPGSHITEETAEKLLEEDLERFERAVGELTHDVSTSQEQFDAMVSLAFNIGATAFAHSSVLRFHKEGDKTRAGDSFLMWCKGGTTGQKRVIPGLLRRRTAERKLYMS